MDSGSKDFLVFALALLASVSAAFLAPTLTTCAALEVFVLGGGADLPTAVLDADVACSPHPLQERRRVASLQEMRHVARG